MNTLLLIGALMAGPLVDVSTPMGPSLTRVEVWNTSALPSVGVVQVPGGDRRYIVTLQPGDREEYWITTKAAK